MRNKLHTSWNSDRIAAAACCRRHSKKNDLHLSALFAQHKVNSDQVEVYTRRGRKVYSRQFGDTILSACIVGDELLVETMNGSRFVCAAQTGKLLKSDLPAILAEDRKTGWRNELPTQEFTPAA